MQDQTTCQCLLLSPDREDLSVLGPAQSIQLSCLTRQSETTNFPKKQDCSLLACNAQSWAYNSHYNGRVNSRYWTEERTVYDPSQYRPYGTNGYRYRTACPRTNL
ncbi:unnamed protein product [Dicrocoelium dendriticum]|nr:unnamed protein product [Dicrocoelium dendriticum]